MAPKRKRHHLQPPSSDHDNPGSSTSGTLLSRFGNVAMSVGAIECACTRIFDQVGAYRHHISSCARHLEQTSIVISERRQQVKRQRTLQEQERAPARPWYCEDDLDVDYEPGDPRLTSRRPVSDFEASGSDSDSAPAPVQRSPAVEQLYGRGQRQAGKHASLACKTAANDTEPVHNRTPHTNEREPESDIPHRSDDDDSPGETADPHILHTEETPKDLFGLYRRYAVPASRTAQDKGPDVLPTSPMDYREEGCTEDEEESTNPYFPFPGESSFRLGNWHWGNISGKSQNTLKSLVDIVGSPSFDPDEIRSTNFPQIYKILGSSDAKAAHPTWGEGTSWLKTDVQIDVPFNTRCKKPGSIPYTMPGFHHRPLVPVIRDKLSATPESDHFHYSPFELRWKPGANKENVQVHGEIYTSPAFLAEHENLLNSPKEPGCDLPRHIVALMFGSDATMLAQFGNAKLWPLYMFFGNDSKYRRSKPSNGLAEHVATFEKLPDDFKDFYMQHSGRPNVDPTVMTHCHRELFHAFWKIILDDEFLEAYEHGIVVECPDGKKRRFYPRIFTYSADYPEKVLIAGIRNLGKCPCPRCHVLLTEAYRVGQARDMQNRENLKRRDTIKRRSTIKLARSYIYDHKLSVNNEGVEGLLQPSSLVPTQNAFSVRLSRFGFDFHDMLVVDLMHEIELGVWKDLFIHLLRILESMDKSNINELDKRYRLVPTFGSETIRRFSNNVSEMKQLAARDFEDLLQCAIPVFDGLLPPPHNNRVTKLLFTVAHWHGLAKLRLHTTHTLALLEKWTSILGDEIRGFVSKTCASIPTKELAREYNARKKQEVKKQSKKGKGNSNLKGKGKMVEVGRNDQEGDEGRRSKTFNMETYKLHALGDYVKSITMFGTTDNYSTEVYEPHHKFVKHYYQNTNKKGYVGQISQIQTRTLRLRAISRRVSGSQFRTVAPEAAPVEDSYTVGASESTPVRFSVFLNPSADNEGTGDPAKTGFLRGLREHLYPRVLHAMLEELRSSSSKGAITDQRLKAIATLESLLEESHQESLETGKHVLFEGNRIFSHSTLSVSYATYDLQRGQDNINPNSPRRDIMCLRDRTDDDPDSPTGPYFLYARVLGIYHANIIYNGPGSIDRLTRRFNFLWVRWYDHIGTQNSWDSKTPDYLRFKPLCDAHYDGHNIAFLDPDQVLRGAHIVPRFAKGLVYGDERSRTGRRFSKSANDEQDWKEYYVDR
ncbi:hypothetical protein CC2G_001925 [Coprinopsis cinerea AmutBmut pab1-1]|nr:hypothetical protein CC2G_001925 [Coprinopsis cinerea AmutBmut pab1-1]